ncbi:hemolysin-III related-domain-containing protein [Pelagophyceae sp. CCMP2097]|nr:hemolysin-III related-domain-containing protein [Pelagophyceae sp. CCMP2097]
MAWQPGTARLLAKPGNDAALLAKPGGGWSRRIGFSDELPEWHVAYPYIFSGYRLNHSVCDCIKSAFSLHNETVNIWTHVAGLALWAHVCFEASKSDALSSSDDATQNVHWGLYALCGLMPLTSAIAHCLCCAGPKWWAIVWRCDFAGILVLLFSRALLEGYLALYCDRLLVSVWTILVSFAFVGGGTFAVFQMDSRPLAPLALLMHAPLVYFYAGQLPWLLPSRRARAHAALRWTVAGSFCGALGFAVRAFRVPERFLRPDASRRLKMWFDVLGASHQWWHVLTIVGPVLCLKGNLLFLAYRNERGDHCPAKG